MAKNVIEVELPFPYVWEETGDEIKDAVLRLLTLKEQIELGKKYGKKSMPVELLVKVLQMRLVRLGPFEAPVDMEVIEAMPGPDFEYLMDAASALDLGYESVEEYRESDEYKER